MANQSSDILASIGAIQTLVDNFPMDLFTAHNAKTYTSTLDFLMDALKTIGVTDTEIVNLVVKEIIGVNSLDISAESLDDIKFQDNSFINTLETGLKSILAIILSDIVSCSIHPKIPANVITNGIDIPIELLDSNKLLNTCPTSDYGLRLYCDVNSDMKPSQLTGSTDLNALLWYCINMVNMKDVEGEDHVDWKDKKRSGDNVICRLNNRGYQKVNFQVGEAFSGASLYKFNQRYLDNTKIISPKTVLMSILDEYMGGLPNVDLNFGFTDVYQEAIFKKIITTIVTNDDIGVDDCYYAFSNEDWYRLMEETELRKFNAKKAGDKTNTAVQVDKAAIIDALDKASTASSLYGRAEAITDAIYNAATLTTETKVLADEGGYTRNFSFDTNINSMWLYNILTTIITPIMKAVLTPKVMALIIMNYEIANVINLDGITDAKLGFIIEGIRRKLLGIIASLTKKVKDWIVNIVLEFFNKKIQPLINKYLTMKLIEELDDWMMILMQALECVAMFGWPGGNALTSVDEVDYADITPQKVKPNQNKDNC